MRFLFNGVKVCLRVTSPPSCPLKSPSNCVGGDGHFDWQNGFTLILSVKVSVKKIKGAVHKKVMLTVYM